MNKNDLFKCLFKYFFDDDLKAYRCLCDLKKSIKTFFILRQGSDLYTLEFKKYFTDFQYFFKDYDLDEYSLYFAFDVLFKWWFCYGFVTSLNPYDTTFIDLLNNFYNFVRLKLNGEKA